MIDVKTGKYPCNAGGCIGDKCIHDWIVYFCPVCSLQLVHVNTGEHVFCSNHELQCDYDNKLKNVGEFLTLAQVLEKEKIALIKRREELKAELDNVQNQINNL